MNKSFIDNLFLKKIKKKKKIYNIFNNNSAFNIDLGIKLNKFDRNDFPIINEMIRNKIIVKVGFDDLYYLDEKKLLENKLNNMKWAMIALIVFTILLFSLYT